MQSVTRFLEAKLRLRVNREKSAVAPVGERKFLGHRLLLNGKLGISPKSVHRAKEKIRQITRRARGVSLAQVIVELNSFLGGWLTYYSYAACRFELQCLDEWIQRKLRCYRLKQRKRGASIAALLWRMGVSAASASKVGSSGKGPWRLASCPPVHRALSTRWFHTQGLVSLVTKYDSFQHEMKPPYTPRPPGFSLRGRQESVIHRARVGVRSTTTPALLILSAEVPSSNGVPEPGITNEEMPPLATRTKARYRVFTLM